MCCRSDASSRRHTALYDIVASDDGVLSNVGNKPATTFREKVASKLKSAKALLYSLFKCCFPTHYRSGRHIEVDSPDDAVSIASDCSTSSNKPSTISPARAACRKQAPDIIEAAEASSLKRCASVASIASLGRRGSDCSSDDGDVGARARGSTIITYACVHRVDNNESDRGIAV